MIRFLHNHSLGLLIIRLMVGVLILFHGVPKIMEPGKLDFIGGTLSSFGLPSVLAYGVYAGEILAPLMIIVGIYSRYAGLVIVINMVFAVLLMHSGDFFSLTEHNGWRLELQAFYLFSALAIVLMGSGRFAIKPD